MKKRANFKCGILSNLLEFSYIVLALQIVSFFVRLVTTWGLNLMKSPEKKEFVPNRSYLKIGRNAIAVAVILFRLARLTWAHVLCFSSTIQKRTDYFGQWKYCSLFGGLYWKKNILQNRGKRWICLHLNSNFLYVSKTGVHVFDTRLLNYTPFKYSNPPRPRWRIFFSFGFKSHQVV